MKIILSVLTLCTVLLSSTAYTSDSDVSKHVLTPTASMEPDPTDGIEVPSIDCATLGGPIHCTGLYLLDTAINLHSALQFAVWMEVAHRAGVKNVVIDISSLGGELNYGWSMIKTIEYSEMNIVCVADISAASMAFAVLESCNKRYITKRSFLVTHQPFVSPESKPIIEDENTRLLTKFTISAYNEYISDKLKMDIAAYTKRVENGKDWFMGWQEALKYNAVDAVVPSVKNVVTLLKAGRTAD